MKIIRITVSGLFDRFDHDLEFKPDEQILIMIGPNGFGKTMILRIVNTLMNGPIRRLSSMPFRTVDVYFDNHSKLSVDRQEKTSSQKNQSITTISISFLDEKGKQQSFTPERRIRPRDLRFPVGMIEDLIDDLVRINPNEWQNTDTGDLLTLEDVVERYEDQLPASEEASNIQLPDWLKQIRESIPVQFVDTERLTHLPPYREQISRLRHSPSWQEGPFRTKRTVRRYSEELGEQVQKTLTEYGSLAQSLDRTFPVRLVEEPPQSDLTMETLRSELAEVDDKRTKLVEAGLLAQELEGLDVPPLDKVDESRRGVLAVFARDTKRKLSIFDDLYTRVDTLKRIANSRFLHKQVTVGPEGISISTSDGAKLELEMLSSGEQHELVLLYDLLFRVPHNSLILIDEPELSLHVAWQEEFLSDLEEMAKISNFQAILATHSPQIIGDRWDLTAELRGPNGG